MIDPHGRRMRKLRVSLTDACNYRCFYCMPADPRFLPRHTLLRPDEYARLCGALVALGIEELRLTGGEPTVRPEFRAIVERLARLPARLGLTSNGQRLRPHLAFLRDQGVHRINLSLDSLDAGKFERITRGGDLAEVLACLGSAQAMGFQVKVNAIVFRGVNDDELDDFAAFAAATGVEVRFLEFMRIGPEHDLHSRRFVAASEIITRLERLRTLTPVPVPDDSTAFVFSTSDGARLGFIASESRAFCGSCSRLRLSALGVLRACLMREDGVSLRHLPDDALADAVAETLRLKPAHRLPSLEQAMHAIGG